MVEEFLGEDEEIIAKVGDTEEDQPDTYLTENRVIQHSDTFLSEKYRDVMLDKIVSFGFENRVNEVLLIAGAAVGVVGSLLFALARFFSNGSSYTAGIVASLLAMLVVGSLAFVFERKDYTIHSVNPEVTLTLPPTEGAKEFMRELKDYMKDR